MENKTIYLLALAVCLTAGAEVINTNTGERRAAMPNPLPLSGAIVYQPTSNDWWTAGWRTIGWTQSPSNGWGVLGSYTITPSSNGYVSLTITNQYNLQIAADAAMTNSLTWTGNFVTNCQQFRTILRAFGTTETQAVVNSDTMSTWLAVYAKTNTITPQLTAQFIFMGQMYPQLLQWGSVDTAHFPWRLIP